MATLPNILAWKILWTEEPGGGCKESDTPELHRHQYSSPHISRAVSFSGLPLARLPFLQQSSRHSSSIISLGMPSLINPQSQSCISL